MLAPKDFVALGIWLILFAIFNVAHRRDILGFNLPDRIFLGFISLFFLQLVWLRIAYPAP